MVFVREGSNHLCSLAANRIDEVFFGVGIFSFGEEATADLFTSVGSDDTPSTDLVSLGLVTDAELTSVTNPVGNALVFVDSSGLEVSGAGFFAGDEWEPVEIVSADTISYSKPVFLIPGGAF